MKILIMSDSHSALSFMCRCIEAVDPDVVIHLGDHYDDGEAIAEEYPDIVLYQVPGNCDRYRCPPDTPLIMYYSIGGVKFYMTHGHLHSVKSILTRLLSDARAQNAQAVLYGHTHIADCRQEDNLWILNPGTCSHADGSVGVIETEDGNVRSCRILPLKDLEE